ncbi:MAG: DUF3944 domain-containing protein, partial [Acidiferrobacteraceae bacterium]
GMGGHLRRNTQLHLTGEGSSAAILAALLAAAELGGFATYRLAAIVADAISRQIIGKGLTLGANAALTDVMGLVIGPVGWALAGLWLVADLAGPAYRVTVPCVLHIAYFAKPQ